MPTVPIPPVIPPERKIALEVITALAADDVFSNADLFRESDALSCIVATTAEAIKSGARRLDEIELKRLTEKPD